MATFFSKLDIRKASVLRKEIDIAIGLLNQSIEAGDVSKKSQLLNAFQIEIDIIEAFRSENENGMIFIISIFISQRIKSNLNETKLKLLRYICKSF